MSNGKDFYVELRKQVTAMQQGGERAGMYTSAQIHKTFRILDALSLLEHVRGRRGTNSKLSIGG